MSNRKSILFECMRRNSEVVALLRDGYGVEDIAIKTGRNVECVRGNVRSLRACGALDLIFANKRSRK